MTLEAIRYNDGRLEILDQLLLPHSSKYIPVNNTEDGWSVIKKMQVFCFCFNLIKLNKLDHEIMNYN